MWITSDDRRVSWHYHSAVTSMQDLQLIPNTPASETLGGLTPDTFQKNTVRGVLIS